MAKNPKKTQECLNNIRIRFPTYENECFAKRTRILRTMITIIYKNSGHQKYDPTLHVDMPNEMQPNNKH